MPARISVIVPTYNGSSWLPDTLASVLTQTRSDFELLIVDDGSTEPVQHLLPADPRVRYIRQNNAGTSAARNAGLTVAQGEYVAFLDHDDLWDREKLAIQAAVLEAEPSVGLVFCDYRSFGDGDRPSGFARGKRIASLATTRLPSGALRIEGDQFAPLVDDLYCQIPSTWLVRKALITRVGGYAPILRRGGEDWHLALRLACVTRFAFLNRVLASRRESPNTLSARSSWQDQQLLALQALKDCPLLNSDQQAKLTRLRVHYARNLGRRDLREKKPVDARRKLAEAIGSGDGISLATLKDIAVWGLTWFTRAGTDTQDPNSSDWRSN